MTPLIREAIKMAFDEGIDPTEVQWFDLSGYIDNRSHAVTEPLMKYRPPFEKNIVVWRGKTKNHVSYDTIFMVVGTDPEEGIVISTWKGVTGQVLTKFSPMFYLIEGDMLKYGPVDENTKISKEMAETLLGFCGNWFESLCQSVQSHKPAIKTTFTNQRKIKEGKMPTFNWTTVVVEAPKPKNEHQGGTHASPKLHDRRGHLRRLKTGKTCWIKAHKVGDITKGVVFHDYVINNTQIKEQA